MSRTGKGTLRLPAGNKTVDVVYKAPRMICTSQHAIKLYAEEYVKRVQRRFIAVSAFSVALTTLPMATTEQKFSDFWFLSGESLPGIYVSLTFLSVVAFVAFSAWSVIEWKKTTSDFMIQQLLTDEDSSTTPTETSTPANVIPMKDFENSDLR